MGTESFKDGVYTSSDGWTHYPVGDDEESRQLARDLVGGHAVSNAAACSDDESDWKVVFDRHFPNADAGAYRHVLGELDQVEFRVDQVRAQILEIIAEQYPEQYSEVVEAVLSSDRWWRKPAKRA